MANRMKTMGCGPGCECVECAVKANFTMTTSDGLTYQFTDTSTGSPTEWHWDFGDGDTSTEQNPTHTFPDGNAYTVTLTAGNGDCETTKSRTLACGNAEEVVVGEWDDTSTEPCNITNCIHEMGWLLQVNVDPCEDPFNCHFVDGMFWFPKDTTYINDFGNGRSGPYLGPSVPWENLCCGDFYRPSPWNAPGACQTQCPSCSIFLTCSDEVEGHEGVPCIRWEARLYDRIYVSDICNDVWWWRMISDWIPITSISSGMSFPLHNYLPCGSDWNAEANGSITILGRVCGGDLDGDGEPDGDEEDNCPCGPSVSFNLTPSMSNCRWDVEVVPGPSCCGVLYYIWSDGYYSTEPTRPPVGHAGGCGDHDPYDLTVTAVDIRGCFSTHTETVPACCKCEDINGVHCSSPGLSILTLMRVDAEGNDISFLECPTTGEEGLNTCSGTDKKWTCRWKVVVDFDDTDNCGNSWFMTAEFTQGGSSSNGTTYHTKEFYIEDVSEGWAPNMCLVFKFTSVTSPPEVLEPYGCDAEAANGSTSGWVYHTALVPNNPFYPGNTDWGCHTPSYPSNCWPSGDPAPCYYSTNCNTIYPGSTPPCEIPEECGGA